MFGSLGTPEIVIIGVIIVLLFGVGKLSGLGKDLGGSVKEFRRAIKDDEEKPQAQQTVQQPPQQQYVQPQQQQYVPPQQPQVPPPQQQYTPPPPPQGEQKQNQNLF